MALLNLKDDDKIYLDRSKIRLRAKMHFLKKKAFRRLLKIPTHQCMQQRMLPPWSENG